MSRAIPIHQRTYRTEAFALDDGRMRVWGRLVDDKPQGLGLIDGSSLVIHDMEIALLVEPDSFTITDVEADMNVQPYTICSDILRRYDQLVGASIARGYSRKVKELFGGPGGCSHMGALLIALGPVAIQASWSLQHLHDDLEDLGGDEVDEATRERRLRMNTDTCHVWRADGDHIESIRRGDRKNRPDWEAARLRELGVTS